MKVKNEDFLKQLAAEFELTELQVLAIINAPFRFISETIQTHEPCNILIKNFLWFTPTNKALKKEARKGNLNSFSEYVKIEDQRKADRKRAYQDMQRLSVSEQDNEAKDL